MWLESDAPGARLAMALPEMVTPPTVSVTETLVRATLPVLVTVKLYVIVSPASACPSPPSFNVPVFVNSIDGNCRQGLGITIRVGHVRTAGRGARRGWLCW